MGILIDASVLIDYERGRIQLDKELAGRGEEEFFLSVVTASELLHGVYRAKEVSIRARRSAMVEAVLDRFPLLRIDLPTARIHAQLGADLVSAGTIIGPNDLWLAAAALAHGLSLVTGNVREFGRVSGLVVERWSS
jgi:tRNA(fMet)-specific endonuclease VapC